MRFPHRRARRATPGSRRSLLLPALVATVAFVPSAQPAAAVQDQGPEELVESARKVQKEFEMFRQSRIPVEQERQGGGCDERIGRICIWFGGAEESDFPAERSEVKAARVEMISHLLYVHERVKDPWVLGQLVHYMTEDGGIGSAERMARECGIDEEWWCHMLRGYVLHVYGNVISAREAFDEGLRTMPPEELDRWTAVRYVIPRNEAEAYQKLDPEARAAWWSTYWRLSDPLFLVEGNDRLTDHLARWVQARNFEDAETPQMFWEEDAEETLIRYGRIQGWSRTHAPQRSGAGGARGFTLQDTRRVVGHHDPMSRGYLFPHRFMESPADVPPESWITAPREARTWYAPPYAPDFRGLESQVGRFRRGEDMLVVGAYAPEPVRAPSTKAAATPSFDGTDPAPSARPAPTGPVQAALFLVPVDGADWVVAGGEDARGVLTLRAPPGEYVSSLEVYDAEGKRAWRARQGVKQTPMIPGLVALSDLVLLAPGAPFPTSLDEAVPWVRPGVRIAQGERFTVVWEVYGLRVEEPARVTIGFTRGRPDFLTRVGDFLGIVEPDDPVEVTFDDPGPDGIQSAFRAVELELPELEPGNYTLHLRLDLPGREPSITSRPIIVE